MSGAPSRAVIVWTAVLDLFIAVLDDSVVNVALPASLPVLHTGLGPAAEPGVQMRGSTEAGPGPM